MSGFLFIVLAFYGVELTNLDPCAMTVVNIYTHLCKAFLGICPKLDPFCSFFHMVKAVQGAEGGATLWLHSDRVA